MVAQSFSTEMVTPSLWEGTEPLPYTNKFLVTLINNKKSPVHYRWVQGNHKAVNTVNRSQINPSSILFFTVEVTFCGRPIIFDRDGDTLSVGGDRAPPLH